MFRVLLDYFRFLGYDKTKVCCSKKMVFVEKRYDWEKFLDSYYVLVYECKKCGKTIENIESVI